MEWAKKGADALSNSQWETAIAAYTRALIEHPTSPDYFVQRSTAFTRLKPARHDLALKDAEYAVLYGQQRAKREKIQGGQQRRVVALHGMGQYGDAKYILGTMEKWRPKDSKPAKMEGDMWSARLDNKLKTATEEQKQVTVKEYPDFELPSEKQVKANLSKQIKSDGSYDFEWESAKSHQDSSRSQSATETSHNEITTTTPISSTVPSVLSKIRHEWFQNTDSVIITLYAKGVAKDALEVDLTEDSLFVSFPHPSDRSSTFTFTLDPLFATVDTKSSKHTAMSTKIEITLKKSQPGHKWPGLEGSERPIKDSTSDDAAKAAVMSTLQSTAATTATGPSYPTSSKTGPKNWDKLATDLTAKKPKKKGKDKENDSKPNSDNEDDADSDYGGDAVDGFFKKLYAGADSDTRRAMMKSFQESNGTALSTNWAEVGQKRVDPVESKANE